MPSMLLENEMLDAVNVYLQKRKTRKLVGTLIFDEASKQFHFNYDKVYLYAKQVIPIGPELPLTQMSFQSTSLFPSFQDRIPSKKNAAFVDYCKAMGISSEETDPLILLATVGRKGPSSFIFEAKYKKRFTHEALRDYRLFLNLSTREFADCFEIPRTSLIKIEKEQLDGHEILKRIELYWRHPEVAAYQLRLNGGILHDDKRKRLLENTLRKKA